MKVTIENKKCLSKDIKVFIDKKTMNSHMEEKYEEIKGTVKLKGFRPGKVPKEVLKRQFGKAVFNEVLEKVLKDTSTKALEENKIKPAGQPKLDLKNYGEEKDLDTHVFTRVTLETAAGKGIFSSKNGMFFFDRTSKTLK